MSAAELLNAATGSRDGTKKALGWECFASGICQVMRWRFVERFCLDYRVNFAETAYVPAVRRTTYKPFPSGISRGW